MKTITYEFKRGSFYGVFMIPSEKFDCVKDKIDQRVWRYDESNVYSPKDKKYYIDRPYGHPKSYEQVVVEQISILTQEGFCLNQKAQEQYEYWNKRYTEHLEKEKIEREKRQEEKKAELAKEQQRIERAKYTYILWCNKYDCQTTQKDCNKCRFKLLINCKPALMKVKVD